MSFFGWSAASQMSAARSKTLRRCCPRVVPGLPPTGAAGVGSLNPSPGAVDVDDDDLPLGERRGSRPQRQGGEERESEHADSGAHGYFSSSAAGAGLGAGGAGGSVV